jgi:hypothetical protein
MRRIIRTRALRGALLAPLPSPSETLFLRTCLPTGAPGRAAFLDWCADVGDPIGALRDPRFGRLLPLLASSLARNEAPADAPLVSLLHAARLREQLRSDAVREAAADVLTRLDARGVPAIVLRGLALADSVYGDRALRHCHDLDLLVPSASLGEAVGALGPAGAGPGHAHDEANGIRLTHASGLPIALHTRLYRDAFYDAGKVRERAATADIAGTRALTLDAADTLVNLGVHAAVVRGRPLQWAVDAWFLLGRDGGFDWDLALERALHDHLALAALTRFRWLRHELDAPIPQAFLDALGAAPQSSDAWIWRRHLRVRVRRRLARAAARRRRGSSPDRSRPEG